MTSWFKRVGSAVAAAVGVCVAMMVGSPAPAQVVADGGPQGPFTPWVGERGITETVEQIMARDALVRPWDPSMGILSGDEREDEGLRDNLPQNPDSPAVSSWPPGAPGGTVAIDRGGFSSRNPQGLGVEFNGPTLSLSGFIPPDTQGSVGPTQVLMCANGRIQVRDRAGVLGGLNTSLDTFFNSVRNGSGISDPMVRYDRLSGRWFVLAINVAGVNRVVLAVSSGSTITSTASFTFYFFQWDTVTPTNASDTGGFFDYPSFGVDNNALYTAGNVFNPGYNGVSAFVINKNSVLTGGPIQVTAFRRIVASSGGTGPFAARGVDNDDPAATEGYFIGPSNNSFGQLVMRRVSNPGGAPSISANLTITVPTTVNPQDQPALGSTLLLDALDDRIFSAQIRLNRITGVRTLTAAHNIEVNSAGGASTTGNRNGSRWYEVGSLTGTPSLVQSGTVFDSAATNPRGFWIPGIAMSGQGHIAIGMSYAGAADRAGCAVAGRLRTDTLGSTQAVTLAEVSTFSYNVSNPERWGDYAQVAVDPNDDMTMWAFIEYCNANNSWAVRAVQLRAPAPATPVSCSPATVNQGDTNVNVVVTGTSAAGTEFFDPGAGFANRIAASVGGTGVTVNSVTFNTPTQVTLNVTVSGSAATGSRTVTVTNPDGQASTSAAGILTIGSGGTVCPTFTTHPNSQTACSGSNVTFTVAATGTPAPTFQWRKNGSNLAGQTSTSLTLTGITAADAGNYDCVATNSCGTATSNTASLTVNTAPSITTQPSNQTVCAGSGASFSVAATGTPAPTFQWRKNGSNIPGATSSTYTIASTVTGDAGSYDCVVTNSCGSVTSNAATLTVNTAPAITTHPTSQTVCSGSGVTFTVAATGSPSPTFQWRKNGSNIGGATSSSFTIASTVAGDAGSYDCVVTNSCGSVTSNAATLTVNTAPSITSHPSNQTACEGTGASFSVTATGTPAPTFQWRKNGVNIGGATASTYSIPVTAAGDAGSYDCVVTNSCGSATSNAATLSVNTAPAITGQPANQTVCEGSGASFSVTASGTGPLNFQWRKNGTNIGGATASTYSIPVTAAGDAGSYDCVVTGACGSATSNAATLSVNTAPAITGQPTNQTACVGGGASFSVSASGSPAPSFQWRKNGVDISGATSSTYSIPAAALGDAGSYDCVVTNSCSSVTSNAATLTVNVAPSITGQPGSVAADVTDTVNFTVSAAGTAPLSYQWRKNGSNLTDGGSISGATTTTLTITGVTLGDAGSYDCVVTNACGSATSDAAALTINCPADFNGDGFLSGDDFDAFLLAFETGDPSADFNGDGFISGDDFDAYLVAFETGCGG